MRHISHAVLHLLYLLFSGMNCNTICFFVFFPVFPILPVMLIGGNTFQFFWYQSSCTTPERWTTPFVMLSSSINFVPLILGLIQPKNDSGYPVWACLVLKFDFFCLLVSSKTVEKKCLTKNDIILILKSVLKKSIVPKNKSSSFKEKHNCLD